MKAYTVLKLNNSKSYNTKFSFMSKTFIARFSWNERLQKRSIQISDNNGNTIVRTTILHPSTKIEFSSNARLIGYNGYIFLYEKPDGSGDIENWSNLYSLIIFEE